MKVGEDLLYEIKSPKPIGKVETVMDSSTSPPIDFISS